MEADESWQFKALFLLLFWRMWTGLKPNFSQALPYSNPANLNTNRFSFSLSMFLFIFKFHCLSYSMYSHLYCWWQLHIRTRPVQHTDLAPSVAMWHKLEHMEMLSMFLPFQQTDASTVAPSVQRTPKGKKDLRLHDESFAADTVDHSLKIAVTCRFAGSSCLKPCLHGTEQHRRARWFQGRRNVCKSSHATRRDTTSQWPNKPFQTKPVVAASPFTYCSNASGHQPGSLPTSGPTRYRGNF
jgi:hypothetical protein